MPANDESAPIPSPGVDFETIPAAVLDTPVRGRNLRPGTFGDQWREDPLPTLLVFLRHFG